MFSLSEIQLLRDGERGAAVDMGISCECKGAADEVEDDDDGIEGDSSSCIQCDEDDGDAVICSSACNCARLTARVRIGVTTCVLLPPLPNIAVVPIPRDGDGVRAEANRGVLIGVRGSIRARLRLSSLVLSREGVEAEESCRLGIDVSVCKLPEDSSVLPLVS